MSGNRPGRNKGMRRSHLKRFSATTIKTSQRVDHGLTRELYKEKDLSRNEGLDQAMVDAFWGQERKRMPIGKRPYDDPKFQAMLTLNHFRTKEMEEKEKKVGHRYLQNGSCTEILFWNVEQTQFLILKRFKGVASRSMIYGSEERILKYRAMNKIVWVSHTTVRVRSSASDSPHPS